MTANQSIYMRFTRLVLLTAIFMLLTSHSIYANTDNENGLLGQSLPGDWRPFSDDSPWNTEIPEGAVKHLDSDRIMAGIKRKASNIRLVNKYNIPLWVVDSDKMPEYRVKSKKIFDTWDTDRDNWSDVTIPIKPDMWGESTKDGHIIIIDPAKNTAWEMSRFKWKKDDKQQMIPTSTTFNIWDLNGKGYALPDGKRWQLRGGRGSGFPVIAGLLRPEQLLHGEIRHALVFTYPDNRRSDTGKDLFISPPAARSDGKRIGDHYPVEGMLFQLDPSLTDNDFDRWGLNREGKIVARALQRYGMYLGDNGGAMALVVQMLDPSKKIHREKWEALFPGFYKNIRRIPTDKFRIVESGVMIEK